MQKVSERFTKGWGELHSRLRQNPVFSYYSRAALGERRGVGQHARLQLVDDALRHHVLHHHCAGHRPG